MRKSTLVARVGGLAIAAAAITSSGGARAAEPGPDTQPLNVVAIEGNEAEDQAEALTKALRTAVRNSGGWSLSPGDYSMEVLVLSMKCTDPPDAPCQARIADEIKVDRYIWGYIKKPKGSANVTGELALWVRGKGTTKIPIEYSANLTEANDDALKKVATEALNKLTGGAPKGGVHVKAGVEGAQLFLDGEPLGALTGGELTLQVPSGAHKLTIKAPGYDDAETQVFIKPAKTTDVALTLTKSAPKTGMSGRAIAGIALIGGGVAAAGVGAIFGVMQLSSNSTTEGLQGYKNLQTATGSLKGKSPCDDVANPNSTVKALAGKDLAAIQDGCSKNKTQTTMEIILYPTGAVLAGVGLYLLITAPSSSKPPAQAKAWRLDPQLGPQGGKLDFTYRF